MAGKRLALLIANANYQHTELRKLNAPHNDVEALQALLRRPEIGGYETQLLFDGSKGQMERAIDRMLADGEREDTALLFFAGHGIKHENGKLYFAAIDTEPGYLGGTAVSAGWLTEQMQNSGIGRQVVLLDCCFGGAFARGNIRRGGDRIESGKELEVPDLELEGRGQVVITSADAMQFALEGGSLKGETPASHFVRALSEGLETGDADLHPQDGIITIDELVGYLRKKMKELGSPQRPSKWTFGSVGGDLLFAQNPWVRVASDPAGAPILPIDWEEQVKQHLNAKDYQKALQILQMAEQTGNIEGSNLLAQLHRQANGGNAVAMNKLGLFYEVGLSVEQDYISAREWYQRAADAGNVEAMSSLGRLYRDGNGVATDYGTAWKWYQSAAVGGDKMAQANLGWLNEQNDLGRWIEDGKVRESAETGGAIGTNRSSSQELGKRGDHCDEGKQGRVKVREPVSEEWSATSLISNFGTPPLDAEPREREEWSENEKARREEQVRLKTARDEHKTDQQRSERHQRVRPWWLNPGFLIVGLLCLLGCMIYFVSREFAPANQELVSTARALLPQQYVVHEGDTIYSLSKQFYGNDGRAADILAANKDKFPTWSTRNMGQPLPTGMTLRIP